MTAIINFFNSMFAYDFMRHAFLAGTPIAIVCAIVGYFVVIRGLAFASHSLGHIGFAGATGAGLVGLPAPIGQLLLTIVAAIGMGALGDRVEKSDTAIGIVLAFFLGLGVLFLYFYSAFAGSIISILFGDILGVSTTLLKLIYLTSIISLIALALMSRPLLFASLEPELAIAKGISLRGLSILFLCIIAIAVTEASQIVGILLVFTLIVGPAASAINLMKTVKGGLVLACAISLVIVWSGILLTYITDWPSSFWISFLSLIFYLISRIK